MQDLLNQLLDQARGMWRFRRPALIAAWVVCVVGWLVVLCLPPVYQATARVYVDTTAVLRPLLQGIAVEQDINAQLSYVRQALLSRPQLEAVARDTDLDLAANTPKEKEELVDSLRERIQIEAWQEGTAKRSGGKPQPTSSLYEISFEAAKRQQALKVVQVLVNNFVDDSLGGKRSGADAAQKFLQAQIGDYSERLSDAEQQLAQFKRRNLGFAPGSATSVFSRLEAEQVALEQAQSNLRISVQRRDELARQLRGESPYSAAKNHGTVSGTTAAAGSDIEARIQDAERQLDQLLLRYTDKHPEVVATRQVIADLKQRQANEIAALQRGEASPQAMASLSANPIYQQVQTQLNQANVDVVAAQSEVAVHQQQVSRLQDMLKTAPEVEAEYQRLTRDYQTTKSQYDELVARLGKAQISESAEETGVVRFEVIDPPNVGVDPVAPDRPRLIALVLVIGLAVGGGIAFILHQLRPVFATTASLGDITGLPVLGAVSRTWRERHRAERRQEVLRVSAAAAGLLVAFGLVMFLQGLFSRTLYQLFA